MTAGPRRSWKSSTSLFTVSVIATMVCCVAVCCIVQTSLADDWPRWRGVEHNNQSTEADLLQEWPEDGPPRLWVNEDAGLGYAGVSIVGDHLYTMGLYDEDECGVCLNAETGEELWRQVIGPKYPNTRGDGPRSTPTVDEDRVYFMSARGVLGCCNRENGELIWSKTMEDFGGSVPMWGYAESPLVDGEKVLCTPGGEQGMVLALDKMTGEQIWFSEPMETKTRSGSETAGAHYSSIVPAELGGQPQYVQITIGNLFGLSKEDGSLLWRFDWGDQVYAVIPSPIVLPEEAKVYASAGYGIGSLMASFENGEAEELYRSKAMKNKHWGMVARDGHVYGASERAGFVCQNLETGEMAWNEREIKSGAVTWADDRFYFIEEDRGRVLLLEANESGGEIRGEFRLDPLSRRRAGQGAIWMHPVIADGKLYLRDQELLHCYDIRDPAGEGAGESESNGDARGELENDSEPGASEGGSDSDGG